MLQLLAVLVKLVFLWSNMKKVSLLRGLVTSSCLAPSGLSSWQKTCLAASVSGL